MKYARTIRYAILCILVFNLYINSIFVLFNHYKSDAKFIIKYCPNIQIT